MDASSAKRRVPTTSATAADEAMLLPLSSSSLPPSHYLQTCPHLLTASPNNHQRQPKGLTTSTSLNDYRRQSENEISSSKSQAKNSTDVDFNNSSRSTSSPQLMSVKSRSKVYRRASLKSLTNLPVMSPAQSKIIKISHNEKKIAASTNNNNNSNNSTSKANSVDENKENVALNPLSSPYPYSTPCQKINNENSDKLSKDSSEDNDNDDSSKQPKSKSSGSGFLPILSLIPNTVISFQYPSPKMKFSWWRNKIS